MLKRRAVHKDMAEANVYAARRLKDMAQSLGGLAKTFGRCREEPGLSREDGIAALEAASAMVCGACESCGIQRECRRGGDDENYYLYYLLRTFEKKGCVEYEDMPRRFLEVCRRKSDYLGQLNRNLGRATMNLTWKNRFLESRAAVMTQFEELAGILEEFSGQMEQGEDHAPLDAPRSDEQPVVEQEGPLRVVDLAGRDSGKEIGDHTGGAGAGVNVIGQALAQGIQSVLQQQHPVKFHLDLGVAHPAGGNLLVNIAVAGAIQGEVAEESVQVGQMSRGIVQLGQLLRRRRKKGLPRQVMGAVAHPVDGGGPERVVVEQQVRPVQADVVQIQVVLD